MTTPSLLTETTWTDALERAREAAALDICQCAHPDPVFVQSGGIHFYAGEVVDDGRELCYCSRCGGVLPPDMILANTPGLEEALSNDILF